MSATSALIVVLSSVAQVRAQDPVAVRAGILAAEDRRAPVSRDLATIRSGLRSGDPQTARIAVRALGRLERPALIPDIVPLLRHPEPEVRAEAANAIAQAAAGLKQAPPAIATPVPQTDVRGRRGLSPRRARRPVASPRRSTAADSLTAAVDPLVSRLKTESDSVARAAMCESLGRLPFTSAAQGELAQRELLASLDRDSTIEGRLGVAAGFEALARTTRKVAPVNDSAASATAADAASLTLSNASVAALRALAVPKPNEAVTAARVRRLAVEALTAAGSIDSETIATTSTDPDAQVRRLAVKAAGIGDIDATRRSVLAAGVRDESPIVRYEALRAWGMRPTDGGCMIGREMAADADAHVALLALDTLGSCGWSTAAVNLLDRAAHDEAVGSPRGWHRPAHALVALASAAPSRAAGALPQFAGAASPWLRMYAARAATILKDRALLDRLGGDDNDNVREAATVGLTKVAGHAADAVFLSQLQRGDLQLVRTAALALSGTPTPGAAIPALRTTLNRLTTDGHDTAHDAEAAIASTLRDLGVDAQAPVPAAGQPPASDVTAAELRRLTGARARITVRGIGMFDLALITAEAPASVIRFAQLAARGYYNGLTFHRIVPDFIIQGGSPGANEYAGDALYMRDELGLWPHVRGAVGVSTRGRDTGDAQLFIDLVDNPRLNHEYTVFAQVLNGMNIVDRILEGDVIERIEIL